MGVAVSIEALKKGFLITDENEEQCAASTWSDAINELEQVLGISGSVPCAQDGVHKALKRRPETVIPEGGGFVFNECDSFNVEGVEEIVSGRTKYRLKDTKVYITREGYAVNIFATLNDLDILNTLMKNNENIKPCISHLGENKQVLVRNFLRDVNLADLFTDEPLIDPEDGYRSILNTNTHTDYDGGKVEGTLEG